MEALLKKEIITNKVVCRMLGVLTFVILTSLGAFVRVPLFFTPVPITLQTFFVLLSGAFLGASLGPVSQISYLFLGLSGLSIFTAAGSGILYLGGPTAGYLWGFILASFFVGKFIRRARNDFWLVFFIFSIADLILLSCGVLWLKLIFGFSFIRLFALGFIPFLAPDLLKISAACFIYLKFNPRIKEIF